MPFPSDSLEHIVIVITELFRLIWAFFLYLHIPIPIGLIGGWRWSIWGLRRLIGHWYRAQEPNGYWVSTAVITPVYNEDPDLFRAALRSWAANQPKEIIAVVDHTDTRCMEQFREFEEEIAGTPIDLKMLITKTPGKRPALADGILTATSDVVFLVDSDTVWDPDVLPKSLAPFIDPDVGGVTVRQRVLNPHSTAQRIFDVYLDIRYIDEIRFLTAFGDAVTCLSGRTAVYRRAVALTALEDLMEETFWGRRVISGDDKALTLAVQSRGWKVRYQDNTCVYTPGATVMKDFLKQRLRWARNSWRADLKALGSRWAWRKPFLAFHLFDRLLQPLTTLIAPIYLGYAISRGHWLAVLLLVGWWTISRTIKIGPHLRRDWKNIRVLPWYITFSYWSAVTKIYAFFTMNQQG
ncbi:MAG TPA: glycosyltransferase [Caldilineaceae bacterium]|nr:glycosyltransferase [Caldilineaceae bacterium]